MNERLKMLMMRMRKEQPERAEMPPLLYKNIYIWIDGDEAESHIVVHEAALGKVLKMCIVRTI